MPIMVGDLKTALGGSALSGGLAMTKLARWMRIATTKPLSVILVARTSGRLPTRWAFQVSKQPTKPIVGQWTDTRDRVSRTFELRRSVASSD